MNGKVNQGLWHDIKKKKKKKNRSFKTKLHSMIVGQYSHLNPLTVQPPRHLHWLGPTHSPTPEHSLTSLQWYSEQSRPVQPASHTQLLLLHTPLPKHELRQWIPLRKKKYYKQVKDSQMGCILNNHPEYCGVYFVCVCEWVCGGVWVCVMKPSNVLQNGSFQPQ